MITSGIDMAADPKFTAAAVIDWSVGTATIELGVSDERIVELVSTYPKVGIDCPLGWPDAFVEFVTAHQTFGAVAPAATIEDRRLLAYRRTDLWCRERKLRPLSVSADRIAHPAFRLARVLHDCGTSDRSGAGVVVETYPAGSMKHWFPDEKRYKTDPTAMAARLCVAVGIECEPVRSEHELDALLCAVTAHAAALGQTTAPGNSDIAVARREGWIHLPACGLDYLTCRRS